MSHRKAGKDTGKSERRVTDRAPAGKSNPATPSDNAEDFTNNSQDPPLTVRGRHEVLQLLRKSSVNCKIYISDSVHGEILSAIKSEAGKRKIYLQQLPGEIFRKRFGDKCQGICAVTEPFNYCDFQDLICRAKDNDSVIVALHGVEDPRNLGAIVRTVEACGGKGIIIPKHRSAGMTDWAVATAQGAAEILPVCRVTNLGNALELLKKENFWVVGLDGAASRKYYDVNYSGKTVIVAGGEDVGLGSRIADICDEVTCIPLPGKTPSLNVSVSVGIAVFEILRQKQKALKQTE